MQETCGFVTLQLDGINHFERLLFIMLQDRILKADINLLIYLHATIVTIKKTVKVKQNQWKLQLTGYKSS